MSIYEFGPFALDAQRLLLFDRHEPVALGPKVVETLLALVEHPGDVLTKSALLERIWPEGYVDEANLAQNVYVLRKLLRARWHVSAIETIPRRGYRFTAPVRLLPDARPAAPVFAAAAPPRRFAWPVVTVLLASALVAAVALTLAVPRRTPAAVPALSARGARLYQIGRYYWNLRTRDGVAKSLVYFERVVAMDPRDARGYAGLASADAIMGDYAYGPAPAGRSFARARSYAEKALALDPNCAQAYAVLGMIDADADASSRTGAANGVMQLRHAIQLDPSDASAHEWYGVALLSLGQLDAAYSELEKAADLDPLSVATTAWLGQAAYLTRRYGDAIGYAHEALDLSPQRYEALGTLGLAYEARGDEPSAVDAFRRMAARCRGCRPEAAALLADVYARMNRPVDARAELAIASEHPSQVEPQDFAIALAAAGQRRVALAWLRRARGEYLRAQIANDPRFESLRSDPQVQQFEQKPA